MEFNKKRAIKISALLIAAFSFLSLCFTFLSEYLLSSEVLATVLPFVVDLSESAVITVAFVYMLSAFTHFGTKFMISRSLLFSLIIFLFILPTYVARALTVYENPFDIIFASAASSLTDLLLIAFRLALIFAFLLLVLKLIYKKSSPRDLLLKSIVKANPFLPSTAGGVALFVCPMSLFAINFVSELFETISFFIKEFDTFRLGELIYIVIYYIYLIPLLLFCIFLARWVNDLFYKQEEL